eukprot:Seg2553.4 transcript_id=Seg2553.4/GoldUCD/mRNA.D3Y31 product="Octopamine receptor" protein_id=Seg2553.4/GoldUCD/D3Y31
MELGFKIVLGIFYVLIGICGLIGNILVIYAIFAKLKHRQRASNIYLLSLAFTDIFTSLIVVPYFMISLDLPVYHPSQLETYKGACQAGAFFVYVTSINRILALSVLSADRYLAILHPYTYQRYMDRKKVLFANFYVYLQSIATNLPLVIIPSWVNYDGKPGAPCGFMWKGKYEFLMPYLTFNFLLPVVVLFISNIRVFAVARKQRLRIEAEQKKFCRLNHKRSIFALNNVANIWQETERNSSQGETEAQKDGFQHRFPKSTIIDVSNRPQGWVEHEENQNTRKRDSTESTSTKTSIDGNNLAAVKINKEAHSATACEEDNKIKNRSMTKRKQAKQRWSVYAQDLIITFSTIVLVILFLISWLPFAVSRSIFVADRSFFSWDVVAVTSSLTMVSSGCNPLIIIGTRRDLRKTIKEKIKLIFRCSKDTAQ